MRAHVIKNGQVVDTIEVESLAFMPGLVDGTHGGGIGDTYNNGTFITPTKFPTETELMVAVDAMLAEGAARKRYDSIHSAALRAGYPGPFHDEGVTYATWMDSVYNTCYTLLGKVRGGQMAYPATTDELLALLPACPIQADTGGA